MKTVRARFKLREKDKEITILSVSEAEYVKGYVVRERSYLNSTHTQYEIDINLEREGLDGNFISEVRSTDVIVSAIKSFIRDNNLKKLGI